jgi:hypothetical protein
MVAFLKSKDTETGKAVIRGWEHPVVRNRTELKPKENCSNKEYEQALRLQSNECLVQWG